MNETHNKQDRLRKHLDSASSCPSGYGIWLSNKIKVLISEFWLTKTWFKDFWESSIIISCQAHSQHDKIENKIFLQKGFVHVKHVSNIHLEYQKTGLNVFLSGIVKQNYLL